jgi:NADPH-dependent glutamate synthase beta subunit-like oxidoreductase
MKRFTHLQPQSIKEAVALLNKYDGTARVNAGGTDLLGILKERCEPDYPEAIINLKGIGGLEYIREDDQGVKVGALTKLADLAGNETIRTSYRLVAEAAQSVATPQVRNMCTVGGNLAQEVRCWYYRYPRELGGPIMCLRKGGKLCNAITGDNRYHSIFGAAPMESYPCASHCPAGTDIPSYLESVRNGDLMEAAETFVDFNPIPAITGRVCPTFCEPECNRGGKDEPVAIRCVERALGDYMLEMKAEIYAPPQQQFDETVAIIGSGPAGLAAAYYLRRTGLQVTIFESMAEAGGMLTYAIPPYRLPKEVVKQQVRALEGMGITVKCGTVVGKDVTMADLMGRFSAVFVATGAWKERPLGIKGESLALSGLDFLQAVNNGDRTIPGKKVAVVGGGNVALDVARTLKRLGAQPTIVYRRSRNEMPAFRDEVEKAEEEGIKFQFLTQPVGAARAKGKVALTCVRMKLGAPDASGRPQPVPKAGSDFTVVFDAVVKAIGEEADTTLLPAEFRAKARKSGPSGRLLGKNLFAGGDFVTGPATVIHAVASACRHPRPPAADVRSSDGQQAWRDRYGRYVRGNPG